MMHVERKVQTTRCYDEVPVQEFIASGRITLIDIDENLRSHSSSEVRYVLARLGVDSSDHGIASVGCRVDVELEDDPNRAWTSTLRYDSVRRRKRSDLT